MSRIAATEAAAHNMIRKAMLGLPRDHATASFTAATPVRTAIADHASIARCLMSGISPRRARAFLCSSVAWRIAVTVSARPGQSGAEK
jgi:hypothetical protein